MIGICPEQRIHADPLGQLVAQQARDREGLAVADLDAGRRAPRAEARGTRRTPRPKSTWLTSVVDVEMDAVVAEHGRRERDADAELA